MEFSVGPSNPKRAASAWRSTRNAQPARAPLPRGHRASRPRCSSRRQTSSRRAKASEAGAALASAVVQNTGGTDDDELRLAIPYWRFPKARKFLTHTGCTHLYIRAREWPGCKGVSVDLFVHYMA
ncbi:hypothetical protein EVAR_5459_1 [Eumeta japonica]|uniref:Uncharacterized protein n=1 Tax=Eumeta variegata TaxID=151549 RepID=A0A4C1T8N6_EUMVA|nr:hypothetical protein EVAR_5459_1 [Eumeta japonica]